MDMRRIFKTFLTGRVLQKASQLKQRAQARLQNKAINVKDKVESKVEQVQAGMKNKASHVHQKATDVREKVQQMKVRAGEKTLELEGQAYKHPLYRTTQIIGTGRMLWGGILGGAAWILSIFRKDKTDNKNTVPKIQDGVEDRLVQAQKETDSRLAAMEVKQKERFDRAQNETDARLAALEEEQKEIQSQLAAMNQDVKKRTEAVLPPLQSPVAAKSTKKEP